MHSCQIYSNLVMLFPKKKHTCFVRQTDQTAKAEPVQKAESVSNSWLSRPAAENASGRYGQFEVPDLP